MRITDTDVVSARRALRELAAIELPEDRPDFDQLVGWLDYLDGFIDRVEAQQKSLDAGGDAGRPLRALGARRALPKLDEAIRKGVR